MKYTLNADKFMSLALCLFVAYAVLLMPASAVAGSFNVSTGDGGGTIANVLCTVVGWFTGPIGQGLATLAIIVIGVGALMGKVSWGMAIIVGVGVAVIFGAPAIVSELGTSGSGCEGGSGGFSAGGSFN